MIWLNDGRKSGMCPFMTRKKDIVLVNLKKKKKNISIHRNKGREIKPLSK